MRIAGARHLADDLRRAGDLDAPQVEVVLPRVDNDAHARVTAQVGPALLRVIE